MKQAGLGGFGKGLTPSKPVIKVSMMDNDNDMDDEMNWKPDMSAAGDFAGRLLMSAPIIHILHLQTTSYSAHKALNKLYDSLPDDADTIIEEFQGTYGLIPSYDTYAPYNPNPVMYVEDLLSFVRQNRDAMGPCSSIQSNIDILVTSIKSCLYKLKNLK